MSLFFPRDVKESLTSLGKKTISKKTLFFPRKVSDSSSKNTFRKKKINFMVVGKIPFATLGNTAAYCFFPTPLSKISMKCYPLTALGMN